MGGRDSDLPACGLPAFDHKAAVESVGVDQVVMRALLDDLAVIDNEDFIGVANSFQPFAPTRPTISCSRTKKPTPESVGFDFPPYV